jgi:DNA-binding HxlR family transcriptional regulator
MFSNFKGPIVTTTQPTPSHSDFPPTAHCKDFQRVAELVGKRWTAAVLRTLFAGCSRFGEIVAAVPGLSNRLLTERLNELEDAGLVVASDEPRPRYSLTERGRDLKGILAEIEEWNQRWGPMHAGSNP